MKRFVFLVSLLLICFFMFSYVSAQEITHKVKTGTISGKLMIKGGGPMAGGHVFIFNDATGPPPSRGKYWRVPDDVVSLDNEGKFSIELPAGRYYLGAIKRVSEKKSIGPPDEGDFFFASADEKGMPKAYIIKEGEKIDIGIISEAMPFKRADVKFGDGITSIEGVVLDVEGKPVEGAVIFAYMAPTRIGKPIFASERTGKNGKYILRVHEGGKYYLRVRSVYGGGPPQAGEIIGDYGEKEPVAVVLKSGKKLRGINIKVRRFAGRGPKALEKKCEKNNLRGLTESQEGGA